MKRKRELFQMRISAAHKRALKRLAKKDDVSMANWLAKAIEDAAAENGYWRK